MILHSELHKVKREGGLERAVLDLTTALNQYSSTSHLRIEERTPTELRDVQAVHFHGLWSQDHITLAKRCRTHNIPYLVSPHGMLEPWARKHKGIKKWIHRQFFTNSFLRGAQCILTTSEIEKSNINRLFPKSRVQNIPLGLLQMPQNDHEKSRKKLGLVDDSIHLLYLSRIDIKKNLLLLIEALGLLKGISQDLHLHIIGDGSGAYFENCINRAKAIRNPNIRITFKGPIWDDSKWDWLAASDLFCLPSSSENFGYAYLESLSVGTPILTTRNTPWAQYSDKEYVLLSEANPHSIASCISKHLLALQEPRNREKAQELVKEHYLWENLIEEYASLYPN